MDKAPYIAVDLTDKYLDFYNSSGDDLSFEEQNPIYTEVHDSVERYRDFEEIGKGGMKVIYQVYDTKSGRDVAFAQPRENILPEYFEAFLREARLTASLQHPNIIPVHDIGFLDETPFFTMELKGGKSLRDLVTRYSLSATGKSNDGQETNDPLLVSDNSNGFPNNQQLITNNSHSELLEVFVKICDAVSYAHSRGVIHLDIKPDNIQIGEYGEVMLCDWGLAKILDSDNRDYVTSSLDSDMLNLQGFVVSFEREMASD